MGEKVEDTLGAELSSEDGDTLDAIVGFAVLETTVGKRDEGAAEAEGPKETMFVGSTLGPELGVADGEVDCVVLGVLVGLTLGTEDGSTEADGPKE